MASQSDIQSLADNIVREFQPEKIILFGSHARGDARPDSDVDLISATGIEIVATVVPSSPRLSFHPRSKLLCEGIAQQAHWAYWLLSNYSFLDCISTRAGKESTSPITGCSLGNGRGFGARGQFNQDCSSSDHFLERLRLLVELGTPVVL
jgi:hypothetical protein